MQLQKPNHTLIEITTLQGNERIWSIDWYRTNLYDRNKDGSLLASVGSSKQITLWGEQNGKWNKKQIIPTDHSKSLRCVKFSKQDNHLGVSSFDASTSIYTLCDGKFEFRCELQGHESEVKCIDWNPQDSRIASCSRDRNIWIWSLNLINYQWECDSILQGHTQDVKYVIWLDQGTVASSSYDNSIRIWQQNDDDYICAQILTQHTSIVWCISIIEQFMCSVSEDHQIFLWKKININKYQLIEKYQQLHKTPIYTCCLLSKELILTGGGDNSLILSKAGQIIQQKYHQNDINCIRIINKFNESYKIASCSDDQTIKIWNLF